MKEAGTKKTPTAHSLSALLCTCFLAKWLCDLKSAYETDADFFFGKDGDSFNDAILRRRSIQSAFSDASI